MVLPEGWFHATDEVRASHGDEYKRELPPIHPLAGIQVELVAYRKGTDDILLKHMNETDRYTVVHLTWVGRQELPNHPTAEFSGTNADFLEWEYQQWGLKPKPQPVAAAERHSRLCRPFRPLSPNVWRGKSCQDHE